MTRINLQRKLVSFNSLFYFQFPNHIVRKMRDKLIMIATLQVPGMGNLERRILEVNKKRVKVVKPGSKTSFPTTEVRGTYAPPFHVSKSISDSRFLFEI